MKVHLWNADLVHCSWSLVVPLSFLSCSSPSGIFLIWRSISGTLISCIILEVSLSLSLSLTARLLLWSFWYEGPSLEHWPLALSLKSRCPSLFPFLLVSFCNLSDMKVHLWNADLVHCSWSLVVPLSFLSCSSPSGIFLIWRSISATLISCIILEVSLSLSLSLTARLLLWSFWYEAHFWNTDLLHDAWSLVASLSVYYARRLNIIFLETKSLLSRQICSFFHYLIRIMFVITKRWRYLNTLSFRCKSHESVSRNLNFTISKNRTEISYTSHTYLWIIMSDHDQEIQISEEHIVRVSDPRSRSSDPWSRYNCSN